MALYRGETIRWVPTQALTIYNSTRGTTEEGGRGRGKDKG